MKRKAVVKLLAGTLCVTTVAGSTLPDAAVAYAESEQQTEAAMETDNEETGQPEEEKTDAVPAEDKEAEAETPENTADTVDNGQVETASQEEDPAAEDTEIEESKEIKKTESKDQEKKPVQVPGGAANDFSMEKKTKKKAESSTDKKKSEKKKDKSKKDNEENPPVDEVFDEGYAAACKTYNDILTNLSFAEDSTVQDTAKFFVDACKEDLKKLADPKRNLSAFLDGSYETAIKMEAGEEGFTDTENVRPTGLLTQYEVSKPQSEEVLSCLNTFVTTDYETPEEKEAALQEAYETLDAYLNASNACRPQVSVEIQENVSVPLAAEETVTENGVRLFGWKYDNSYTGIRTNDMATIQAYAEKGGKYIIKLLPKADGKTNLYCSQRIDVSNKTKLVIVSESSKISLCVHSSMSKDPNIYSDMFRVEKGSSLTLGDNEGNGKHGVTLDGKDIAHMGRLVFVEVGGSFNIYPGTEIKNNNSMDGRGSGIFNKGTMKMYGGTISGNKFATTEKNFQAVHISDNDKTYCHGGGLRNDGTCTIMDGTISGNTAASGGGIYTTGPDYESDQSEAVLKITKCDITGNKALGTNRGTGGGIVVGSYMGTYYDKKLKKNVPYVKSGGTLVINGGDSKEVHIGGNTAGNGSFGIAGGIMNNGYADIKNCIIENNQAYSKGAVKNASHDAGKPDIRYQGTARHEGTMVMDNVSIKNNVARKTGDDSSSAIGNHGNMTIKNSSIHDNTSKGVANCDSETDQSVTLTVQNTEIYKNKSDGIHAYGKKSSAVIDGCSVHDNSGHGIRNSRSLTFSGSETTSNHNGTANHYDCGFKNDAGGNVNIHTGLNITKSIFTGVSNAGKITLAAGKTLTVRENNVGIDNTGTFQADGTLDVQKNSGTAVKNSESGKFDLNSNSTIVNTVAGGTAITNEGKGVFTVKSGTTQTISGAGVGISNGGTFHHNGKGSVTGTADNGISNNTSGVLNITAGVKVTGNKKIGISNAGTVNVETGASPTISGQTGISNSGTVNYKGNGSITGTADRGISNGTSGVFNITAGVKVTGTEKGISNAGTVNVETGASPTISGQTGISNSGTVNHKGNGSVTGTADYGIYNGTSGVFGITAGVKVTGTEKGISNAGKVNVETGASPTITGKKGISNSGTVNHKGNGSVTGTADYGIYNDTSGVFGITAGVKVTGTEKGISNAGKVNVETGASPTITGKKGISNSGTVNHKGNGSVMGTADNGIYNDTSGVLNVMGGVYVTGSQKSGISNAGTATISGAARVRSDSQTALSNGRTGTCTISGNATFQYTDDKITTVNDKSIYNEGRLINTSNAHYRSSDNNSVLQKGTFEISSAANHPKNLCIYLYDQKFVTVTGALTSVNYLQPKNRKAGRKVAQASYAGADGSTILSKLALTDDSKFCLRSGKTLNLKKANAALKGSGVNASDLTAKDVILSETVQIKYKSGLSADIACTMPKTQDAYWCEYVKVKASVNVNGKEIMKPYIQDKAKRNVYQFLGWYDKDGVQRYNPLTNRWYDPETKKWSAEYTYSGTEDLVLTARWEKSYNIAYHGNGQTVGDDYTQEKDKSLIISDTEMYKFDGKFYKGLVGEDTFKRTETYKKDKDGNLLDKNGKKTDEKHAAKLTSLNPDTGKEEPCEEQYSVKKWGTSANVLKTNVKNVTFELGEENFTNKIYDDALNTTNDKGENLCITYDAPDDMVKKGREEKPADKLTLGVKKQDATVYGASHGKMSSGTWLNMYAVWDKFPQLDAYNRYFTKKQAENGEITPEALLTTLRFKDEEDTNGKYLYSRDYAYNKKENCIIIKGKDGTTMKLRAETDMDTLLETGEGVIRYTLTDSAGNITTKEVQCSIVDTSDIPKEYETYVRFISPKYYKKNGAYVPKENGGLEENSIWKTDPEYAALLDKAMSNEKRGIKKKSVRVFGVKFEADDPGSGTWDYEEETWEFTHEQVKSVDDFVDKHGYMNYKEKDGLKKFREEYKGCIK